ncbi:MAG: nicotinate phosphoribosyltransferase [Bacilli bacterium]|jgi:nicotinate phosphoribosyltransferase|nr:nicotinate phosphoribosyltransferase [Bacilli bacterium]
MSNEICEMRLKEKGEIERLSNKTFKFDPLIAEGFYSANYFLRSRRIVLERAPGHIVTEQWFQRRDDAMACGLDESIALIHTFAHHPETLRIEALKDGEMMDSGEPALKVTGRYEDFGFLESLIDGILARRSSVATNVNEVVRALRGTNTFSMADRQDDYLTQAGDGYATYVAGIKKFSTDAQGAWVGVKGIGTMPHALIEICGGDVYEATMLYHKTFPDEPATALIDYHNNCVYDAVDLAKRMGRDLSAVRVDTSKALIDHYFDGKDTSLFDPHGVCKELIFALRKALDEAGAPWVKIVVSSGFTAEKIDEWTRLGVPVDTYGVGSALVRNTTVGFTGDLVRLDGRDEAKEGRRDIPSKRLHNVQFFEE